MKALVRCFVNVALLAGFVVLGGCESEEETKARVRADPITAEQILATFEDANRCLAYAQRAVLSASDKAAFGPCREVYDLERRARQEQRYMPPDPSIFERARKMGDDIHSKFLFIIMTYEAVWMSGT